MPLPIVAHSLSFAYNESEDRLVLLTTSAAGENLALLFTRRLTNRLINGLAGILEKSSAAVSQAPAAMRDDVIMLEHHGAVSTLTDQAPAEPSAVPAPPPSSVQAPVHLVTSVDVKTTPAHFEVVLKNTEQPLALFTASRAEIHRIVDVLGRHARDADWAIKPEAAWLELGQTSVTLN